MKRIWHWNRESTLTISGDRHLREKTTQTNEIYLWAPKCGAVVNLGAMQIYIYVFSMKKDNFHASHFYYWHSILLIVVCCPRLIRGAQYRAYRTKHWIYFGIWFVATFFFLPLYRKIPGLFSRQKSNFFRVTEVWNKRKSEKSEHIRIDKRTTRKRAAERSSMHLYQSQLKNCIRK